MAFFMSDEKVNQINTMNKSFTYLTEEKCFEKIPFYLIEFRSHHWWRERFSSFVFKDIMQSARGNTSTISERDPYIIERWREELNMRLFFTSINFHFVWKRRNSSWWFAHHSWLLCIMCTKLVVGLALMMMITTNEQWVLLVVVVVIVLIIIIIQ